MQGPRRQAKRSFSMASLIRGRQRVIEIERFGRPTCCRHAIDVVSREELDGLAEKPVGSRERDLKAALPACLHAAHKLG